LIECPQPKNTTPWIIINVKPSSKLHVGDVFEINGTTNLRDYDNISLSISNGGCCHPTAFRPTNINGFAVIQNGNCNVNKWSFSVNLTGAKPDLYFVQVTGIDIRTNRSADNTTLIDVLPNSDVLKK
jgi:hypothetical protein